MSTPRCFSMDAGSLSIRHSAQFFEVWTAKRLIAIN